MEWLPLFSVLQIGYRRQLLERDGAYAGRPFPNKNVSDNGSPRHRKVSLWAWFLPLTWLKQGDTSCFRTGFSVYFDIITSKNLQKPSVIQNNTTTFLLVIIGDYCLYLFDFQCYKDTITVANYQICGNL